MKYLKLKHKILDALYFMKLIEEDLYLYSDHLTIPQLENFLKIAPKKLTGILESLENSGDIQRIQNGWELIITKKGIANWSDKKYLNETLKLKKENVILTLNIITTLCLILSFYFMLYPNLNDR